MNVRVVLMGLSLMTVVCLSSTCPAQVRPSDGLLTMAIERHFRNDARLRDAELKVTTLAGVVTLQGEVASYLDKLRAERLCKQVDGVRELHSKIRVGLISASDDQISQDIETRWKQDRSLESANIKATVCRHVVTIQGTAQDQVQVRRAEQLAREVRGVQLVRNEVEVGGPDIGVRGVETRSDRELEADAIASLRRDSVVAGLPIAVSVSNRIAVLSGAVANLYEKQRAANLVRLTPGVLQVDNQLSIDLLPDTEPGVPLPPMEQIVRQVYVQLGAVPNLDASNIEVSYTGDLLILQGSVPTMFETLLAANAVRRVTGVTRIANRLGVTDDKRDDLAIREAIHALLASDAVLTDEQIEVAAEQGVVVLAGRVGSFGNKRRAVQLAARVRGVQSIRNNILVSWSPDVSDDGLAKRIEARLRNNARTKRDADEITVQVADGVVTLQGYVSDESTLHAIHYLAKNTDCVRSVLNQLRLKPAER